MHWRRKWQPTPVFLPGESQGWGAWWAAIYGVTQSRTRLTWLTSSSSTITAFSLTKGLRVVSAWKCKTGHTVHICWKYLSSKMGSLITLTFESCFLDRNNVFQKNFLPHNGVVTFLQGKVSVQWENMQTITKYIHEKKFFCKNWNGPLGS